MSTNKPLDQFEQAAKSLFEGSLAPLLGHHLPAGNVSAQLVAAVQETAGSERIVANLYTLALHPADLRHLKAENPTLATDLRAALAGTLADSGQEPAGELQLLLVAADDVPRHQARVTAGYTNKDAETTYIQRRQPELIQRQIAALDAFLIVDGHRHVPLDRPLITLGRSVENDIVLDHTAVSRRHAQIRWRYGHFVLFDTGSTGGVFVDDRPVKEWMFQPGDLVYLSRKVPLIYGEGVESPQRLLPLSATAGDETQAIPQAPPSPKG